MDACERDHLRHQLRRSEAELRQKLRRLDGVQQTAEVVVEMVPPHSRSQGVPPAGRGRVIAAHQGGLSRPLLVGCLALALLLLLFSRATPSPTLSLLLLLLSLCCGGGAILHVLCWTTTATPQLQVTLAPNGNVEVLRPWPWGSRLVNCGPSRRSFHYHSLCSLPVIESLQIAEGLTTDRLVFPLVGGSRVEFPLHAPPSLAPTATHPTPTHPGNLPSSPSPGASFPEAQREYLETVATTVGHWCWSLQQASSQSPQKSATALAGPHPIRILYEELAHTPHKLL